MKFGDITVSFVILAVILLIIVPLSPVFLDFLLIINISLAILILLTSLYITEPLEFSVFPSLLLIVTLFRLGLNISSTRLILSRNGEAGNVIKTFGNFVTEGNLVVGIIVFLIIIVIQFIVITKGSERVAEVAARFTLDAMPGKQMAIDADLNSGIINEQQARDRRKTIQREADFYGAMDGASKFVKGDAIVGILVTIINIVGGMIIGSLSGGMPIDQVVKVYSQATIGDGLASQIPALLISTATGITVTRAASDNNMGRDVTQQLFGQPMIMIIAGSMLMLVNLIPGLPHIPLFILSVILIGLGYSLQQSRKKIEKKKEEETEEKAAQEKRKPDNVNTLLQVDPIELEFGYNIIPLVDANQGGDLLDRVVAIRKQFAMDLGMIIPVIRLRDNMQLEHNKYVIKIKGTEVAAGEVYSDRFLAMKNDDTTKEIDGIATVEPAFGLPAKWVDQARREAAELAGYTLVDPSSVIATHLTEILKQYGHELLSRQQVQNLIDNVKQSQPALVDDIVPKLVTLGELQRVLTNLLREGVPIRDIATILETLGDYAALTKDTDMLTEYVRQNLRRTITKRFIQSGSAFVIGLDPDVEQLILNNVHQTRQGSYVTIDPDKLQTILLNLKIAIENLEALGAQPLVVTSPVVRYHFKKMTEQLVPELVILSYNEIEQYVQIHAKEVVGL